MKDQVFERDIFVSSESSGQRLFIALSTALQTGLLAAFLVLSLLGRQTMPPLSSVITVPWLPSSQPSPPPRSSHPRSGTSGVTRAPSFVFQPQYAPHIAVPGEEVPPPSIPSPSLCLQNCSGPLLPLGLGSSSAVKYAPAPRPVISDLQAGQIQHRVQPIYPEIAKVARIEGDVVLSAIIAKNGEIQRLQAMSGHPLLLDAALDAVRQWRFRPYILNGRPIEIETRITVRFRLQ
jgi:protein TonB